MAKRLERLANLNLKNILKGRKSIEIYMGSNKRMFTEAATGGVLQKKVF